MKTIQLSQGKEAIVDDEDYERLNIYKWSYGTGGYAERRPWNWILRSQGPKTFLHRAIMHATKGDLIDHINGNPLDNRRANLRFCTQHQNQANRPRLNKNNTIGFRGVAKNRARWSAKCRVNYKNVHIGTFDTPQAAAEAYNAFARRTFGEFAVA